MCTCRKAWTNILLCLIPINLFVSFFLFFVPLFVQACRWTNAWTWTRTRATTSAPTCWNSRSGRCFSSGGCQNLEASKTSNSFQGLEAIYFLFFFLKKYEYIFFLNTLREVFQFRWVPFCETLFFRTFLVLRFLELFFSWQLCTRLSWRSL